MRKLHLAVAVLAAAASLPAAAVDFGATLSSDSTYTYQGEGTFQELARSLLWVSAPVGKDAGLYVSGLYEFKGSFLKDSSDVDPWRIDAGRVEFSGSIPGALGPASTVRYSVGRIDIADHSAMIIDKLNDGARASAEFGNASVFLAAGYRGLLYKSDAYSMMDLADIERNSDDGKYFAAPRGFAGLGAKVSELLPKHDIGVDAFAQFDFSDSSDKTQTQYFEPYIQGKVSYFLSWGAWGILELIENGDSAKAAAYGESIVLSFPDKGGLAITQSLEWASGDKGSMSAFNPIRRAPIDATSYFTFTDILKVKLELSGNLSGRFSGFFGGAAYFRTGETDPESGSNLSDKSDYYRAAELSAGASARVASDLSFNLSGGILVPNAKTPLKSAVDSRSMVELYATFDL